MGVGGEAQEARKGKSKEGEKKTEMGGFRGVCMGKRQGPFSRWK